MTPEQNPSAQRRIGRYRILREIGRGTMGVVYEAVDPNLDRRIALKTVWVQTDNADRRDFEERFRHEGKLAARLNHPNVVTIYDAGEDGGLVYIAMEYLEGRTLHERLHDTPPPTLEECLRLACQMADALEHAHRLGIVHRDIKPANIILSNAGVAKLSDFGIAQLYVANSAQTSTMFGTPKYMSPEHLRSEVLDGRSDVFSLGVILYEMFAGCHPFAGDNLSAIMYRIAHVAPADPRACNPACPAEVAAIIAKCLAKERPARYQSASQLAADLRGALAAVANEYDTAMPRSVVAVPAGEDADKTIALHALPSPARAKPVRAGNAFYAKWLLGGGALCIAGGLLTWQLKRPPAEPPVPAAVTAPAPAPLPLVTPPAATNAPAVQKPQPKAAPAPKPRKSFWQRQVDCFKRGICEKPLRDERN